MEDDKQICRLWLSVVSSYQHGVFGDKGTKFSILESGYKINGVENRVVWHTGHGGLEWLRRRPQPGPKCGYRHGQAGALGCSPEVHSQSCELQVFAAGSLPLT